MLPHWRLDRARTLPERDCALKKRHSTRKSGRRHYTPFQLSGNAVK